VGSSTRIEGSKLSDVEVEKLLSRVAGQIVCQPRRAGGRCYADAMDMIFDGYDAITPTENHLKQLHGVLLKYSTKDQEHRANTRP